MISEPELEGGEEPGNPEVLTADPPPRPPRSRRPWLWALGGAVVASALWGGVLYAYGQREPSGPDLRGYGAVENLCEAARLEALAGVLGKRTGAGSSPLMDEAAVHESECSVSFGSPGAELGVRVAYTLHRVVDPGPEFEARCRQAGLLQKIDGIGEQAFFEDMGEDGGRLRVLDGQAEIDVVLYHQREVVDGEAVTTVPSVDLSGIETPMTKDVLALMAALRK
ncbi:hypothetical protein [Streptomyces sp. NPDC001744]|uniref:hypothetical protein n=1 Tax=Streptomyces sp. NPDC001744 TaxID=3364606 RepID=UPI00369A3E3D